VGFDVVYDTVGGTTFENSAAATRLYGRLISCAAWEAHDLAAVLGRSLSLIGIFMLLPMLTGSGLGRHGAILREVAVLVESSHLRPLVDPARFTLEQAARAQAHLASGRAVGKVVVDIVL
jgi:NADPH2:quinone reductase